MTVSGEGRDPRREHCLRLAATHGIAAAQCARIIEEVDAAVARWADWADAAHVPKRRATAIARQHRALGWRQP